MSAAVVILALLGLLIVTAVGLVFRRVLIDMAEERRRSDHRVAPARPSKAAGAGKACLSGTMFALGPTLLFVLTYAYAPTAPGERLYVASAVLAAAVVITVAVRHAKPLPNSRAIPWRELSIVAMAGLTVALHDDLFVKVRPTVTAIVGALLAVGTLAGVSSRLHGAISRDSVSVDDAGWRKLVAISALLGIAMAALNEYVRRFKSEAFWVYFQLWGPALLIGLFLIAAIIVIRGQMPAGQCPARPRAEQSEPSNDQ